MSNKKSITAAIISMIIAALLVGIDRLTKWLVVSNVELNGSVSGIKGVIDITYIHNNGAAFGILSGKQTFLIAVTSVFLVVAIAILFSGKVKSKFMMSAITLIVAGGVGNLIDRINSGYVVDFIELRFVRFAVFNFADICAVCGAFLLGIFVIGEEIRDYKARKACTPELEEAEIDSNE